MIQHKNIFKKHTAEYCLTFRVLSCPQVYQITKLVDDITQIYIFISGHKFTFNLDIFIFLVAWLSTPLKSYVNSRSALLLFASTEVHEIAKLFCLAEDFFFLGKSSRGLRQVNRYVSFCIPAWKHETEERMIGGVPCLTVRGCNKLTRILGNFSKSLGKLQVNSHFYKWLLSLNVSSMK